MSVATEVTALNVAFDDYPHTLPLKRGEVSSPDLALHFTDIKPANRFFKPMVRELKFDVSEMAIATFVQAKSYGKQLVLLPATMMGRFQQGTLLCRAAKPMTPADLPGKRVGVRSYSQTTAVWVRGILQNDYGVDVDRIHWVTQEDGHLAEYREPASVERVGPDKNLLKMLRDGELDAAIYGADLPKRSGADQRHRRSGPSGSGLVRQAQGRADQSHGGGDRDPGEVEPACGARNLPPAGAGQEGGRRPGAGRDRLPAVRFRRVPPGAADRHRLRVAAKAHRAENCRRGTVRRHHPRARAISANHLPGGFHVRAVYPLPARG